MTSDPQRIVATTLHGRDDLAACPLDEDEATAALPGTRAGWWTSPRMSRRTRRDTLLWRDAETLGSPSGASHGPNCEQASDAGKHKCRRAENLCRIGRTARAMAARWADASIARRMQK